MSNLASLNRIRNAVRSVYGLNNLHEWIEKNTNLNNRPYSFKGYEYQIPIIQDPAKKSIIIKAAQVGLSELAYRWNIAACCVVEDFTALYIFPSSSDAERNNKTRVGPMIDESPELQRLIDPEMNNSEIKKWGRNSFLMFRGTKTKTAALSTPANSLTIDEFDKCDIDVATTYVSRLQNRPHKIQKIFSTPTVEKYGVSKETETATRMMHFATCAHCSHRFLPDYFNHVKVPGWDKPMEEITKANLNTVRWREAVLLCPNCGRDPNLHHSRMEFVAENANENHDANAWFVSPWSVPTIITPSYLVQVSTQFSRYSEYKNQALGITAEEKNEAILASDIDIAQRFPNLQSSEFCVAGSDLGITCYIVIGRVASDGTMVIIHRERIHYTMFEERTSQLCAQYRVVLHVMDSMPYTDLISRICKKRAHHYGAIFVTSKSPQTFVLDNRTEDEKKGKMELNLVKVNRTAALDALLGVIKDGTWAIQSSEENEIYKQQMLSLKRIQRFTKDGELNYVWEKVDHEDHYHFATLYFYIATQMRKMVGGLGSTSVGIPLVTRFKQK
jgi:hypothetical protein